MPNKEKIIDTLKTIKHARQILEDKKGEHIAVLDVRDLSSVTDYYVICTGNNPRHFNALIEACATTLAETGRKPYRTSGTPESAWMILDYIDFVVHIFGAEAREHYALEALWKDAPRVKAS